MKTPHATKTRYRMLFVFLVVVVAMGWFFLGPLLSAGDIRNVVLISIDTCRADRMSCYGYPHPTTPNIDAIAREGVLFEQVIAPAPMTLPSHCSMLTGTNPPYHGVHRNINYRLGDSNVTLAEILREGDFRTGAVVSGFTLHAQFGLDQGFNTYEGEFTERFDDDPHAQQKGEETSRLGMKWLEEHGRDPFFLFLHYYDAHLPYEPPEPFFSKFPRSLYAAEVHRSQTGV